METTPPLRLPMLLAACSCAAVLWHPAARADDSEAVSAAVSDSYVRVRLSDGSFQPETYTFGEGGHLAGPARDDSIDRLTFIDVARVLAVPLAHRNYVPVANRNPDNTKLLIMVYWGTTHGAAGGSASDGYDNPTTNSGSAPPPPEVSFMAHCSCDASQLNTSMAANSSGPTQNAINGAFAACSADNSARRAADMRNAMLLGYDTELAAVSGLALRSRREDLIAEVEVNRDFIVLKAYDFQALWKQRKHRLLWVTRMSVRQRGTDFARVLPAMASCASGYFGRDSRGLARASIPEGYVDVGEVKNLGEMQEK